MIHRPSVTKVTAGWAEEVYLCPHMAIEIIAYALAVLVGVSLGLIGSGGSILTVPILVYVMGVEPVMATAYSLFVVGTTALVGGAQSARQGKVDFKTVLIFGVPSIAAVYLTRAYLLPIIADVLLVLGDFTLTKPIALMLLFAIVMILAAVSMIRPSKHEGDESTSQIRYHYPMILLEGAVVGVLTGLVGAGGGFLIIPALVLLARMPMKLAVGTSLFIIAAKSLLGFLGDLQSSALIDWSLLLWFTLASVIGIFVGIWLSGRINGDRLKSAFGWFVLLMGIFIVIKEIGF